MYGDNYPDGFNRSQAIAAGIEEEYPGFESHFDSVLDDLTVEEYEEVKDDLDSFREEVLRTWLDDAATAKGEYLAEMAEYEAKYGDSDYDAPW